MKTNLIYLLICLTFIASGCKKETFELPEALVTARANLTDAFESLNQNLASAVVYTISVNEDTALIRAKFTELLAITTDMAEFVWVTPAGIMQIIEPPIYHGSQGADISTQDHIKKAFSTRLPVLSRQFFAVERFYAAVVIHPVVDNNTISGGIAALFFPEQILENILKPIFEGQEFELWVMEEGGKILYDQDAGEIGLDLFTDPLYQGFPELLTAGHRIDGEESGQTTYSFYKAGTMTKVTKLTYWNTFELYGTKWKLVWVKPEV